MDGKYNYKNWWELSSKKVVFSISFKKLSCKISSGSRSNFWLNFQCHSKKSINSPRVNDREYATESNVQPTEKGVSLHTKMSLNDSPWRDSWRPTSKANLSVEETVDRHARYWKTKISKVAIRLHGQQQKGIKKFSQHQKCYTDRCLEHLDSTRLKFRNKTFPHNNHL